MAINSPVLNSNHLTVSFEGDETEFDPSECDCTGAFFLSLSSALKSRSQSQQEDILFRSAFKSAIENFENQKSKEEIEMTARNSEEKSYDIKVTAFAGFLKGNSNEDRFLCSGSFEDVTFDTLSAQAQLSPLSSLLAQNLKIYAVIDGHGGGACADYIQDNLARKVVENWSALGDVNSLPHSLSQVLEVSLIELDQDFIKNAKETDDKSGACVVVALVFDQWLCVGNVGDAAGVLYRGQQQEIKMSEMHTAQNRKEYKRVRKAGGKIDRKGYIQKVLQPSRTIGDWAIKQKYPEIFIATPQTYCINLHEATTSKFNPTLILASDGLWDIGWEKASFFIKNHIKFWEECNALQEYRNPYELAGYQDPAMAIVNYARFCGSADDITVLFLSFSD